MVLVKGVNLRPCWQDPCTLRREADGSTADACDAVRSTTYA